MNEDFNFWAMIENCNICNFSVDEFATIGDFIKIVAAKKIAEKRKYRYSFKILNNLLNQYLSPEIIGKYIKNYDVWFAQNEERIELESESILNLESSFKDPEKIIKPHKKQYPAVVGLWGTSSMADFLSIDFYRKNLMLLQKRLTTLSKKF